MNTKEQSYVSILQLFLMVGGSNARISGKVVDWSEVQRTRNCVQSVIQGSILLTNMGFPAPNWCAVLGSRERNKVWV